MNPPTPPPASPAGRLPRHPPALLPSLRHLVTGLPILLALLLAPVLSTAAPTPPRGLLLDVAACGNALVAVGEHGTILRSTDSGRSWEHISSPVVATLTSIVFVDGGTGWAAGHDGVILHSNDAGESWTLQYQSPNLETVFLDLAAIDSRRVFATGAFGTFLSSVDGGREWTPRSLIKDDLHLNRITLTENNRLYIACERGTLLRLTDFGRTTLPLPSPYNGSFYGVLPLGPDTLLAYGLRGNIFRSTDNAQTWQRSPTSSPPALAATALKLKSGTIIIAGQARSFLISLDDGQTFSPWDTPLTTAVAELIETPDGSVLAVGEAGPTRLEAPPPPQPVSPPPSAP